MHPVPYDWVTRRSRTSRSSLIVIVDTPFWVLWPVLVTRASPGLDQEFLPLWQPTPLGGFLVPTPLGAYSFGSPLGGFLDRWLRIRCPFLQIRSSWSPKGLEFYRKKLKHIFPSEIMGQTTNILRFFKTKLRGTLRRRIRSYHNLTSFAPFESRQSQLPGNLNLIKIRCNLTGSIKTYNESSKSILKFRNWFRHGDMSAKICFSFFR